MTPLQSLHTLKLFGGVRSPTSEAEVPGAVVDVDKSAGRLVTPYAILSGTSTTLPVIGSSVINEEHGFGLTCSFDGSFGGGVAGSAQITRPQSRQ
jgi:hypothetical protein